jgi:hypothetical protein
VRKWRLTVEDGSASKDSFMRIGEQVENDCRGWERRKIVIIEDG